MIPIIVESVLPQPNEAFIVESGKLYAIPFDLGDGQTIEITIIHVGAAEDYALRAWVSAEEGENPEVATPAFVSEWNPTRSGSRRVWAYDRTIPTPAVIAPLPLPVGCHYLNIENISGSMTACFIALT